jgi:hypothetical protein
MAVGRGLLFGQQPRNDVASSTAALRIDGKLDDAFWQSTSPLPLRAAESGAPSELGGHIRVGLRGVYLCFAARMPEPGGKVLARSIGRNPVWEIDATGSPPVEDRIEFRLADVLIAVNPWGAYRLERRGAPLPAETILPTAQVDAQGWSVELAIPLDLLEGRSGPARFERIRSRRPLAPEFRWSVMLTLPLGSATGASLGPPEFHPPLLGNTDPPLEVGGVRQVPPVAAEWDDPAWRQIPAFELPRNEPHPRPPRAPSCS